ncbi:hypothetical protein A2773_05300 [Candidatus Gottesmanbacteria bacterium RIFCSPHIGHO2_01_FULL_39_10]|uniref:Cyclase n=1 Tax=Candidatus Gottesmanbacteria bacterium RIFCSPHIGHO2_01_FULL_39_10 TaxID=1798375 RepID=A0A1F5ZPV9_9BACT|nr:MAG: hypothetical protein A2773_05300 [Candidatus Gottesmanbacteria bacterium RIFCSPHIGHO2_01_FULL_39_10]
MKKSFQYIDLSIPLTNQTQVYPGDPIVSISPVCGIEKDGFSMHSFHFGGHSGTHIDAQSHFITGGKHIDEYGPEKFVGEGKVIDARERNVIDIDILKNITLKKDAVVLFYTDYIKNREEVTYFENYPVVGKTLAERLISIGVKMIGIDAPSIDHEPYPLHKMLLGNDILILENLCNLDQIYKKKLQVYAFPIKVPTDGVPVRVVAEVRL